MRRLLTAMSCISLMFVVGCGSNQGQDSATTGATVTETVTVTETPDLDEFHEDLYDENAGQGLDGVLSADALPKGLDVAGDGQLWAFFSEAGGVGGFRIPSEESEYCQSVNDYLKRSSADLGLGDFKPYGCVTVAVDNSEGTEDINMYALATIDGEGNTSESIDISDAPAFMHDDSPSDLYNEGVELSNAGQFFLRPGARGETTLFFFEESPSDDVSRIYVMPSGGFEEVEALRVE